MSTDQRRSSAVYECGRSGCVPALVDMVRPGKLALAERHSDPALARPIQRGRVNVPDPKVVRALDRGNAQIVAAAAPNADVSPAQAELGQMQVGLAEAAGRDCLHDSPFRAARPARL